MEGYSEITLPSEDSRNIHSYSLETSATSGSVSTPYFEEKIDENLFRRKVYYHYAMHFNGMLLEWYPRAFFVLELRGNIEESVGGEETIDVQPSWEDMDEYFQYSGNFSIQICIHSWNINSHLFLLGT